jgi:hypothetical protein
MGHTAGWEPRTLRQRVTRAIVALGVVAAVAGASSTLAPSASAAGILPTTTTVAAAPAASTEGDSVTLTATVKLLGILPGLGVTPTGPVAFTASDGSSTTALGTSPVGSCLLTTCTATLSTDDIPAGSTTVTATYAGDTLSAASSGSAAVTVARRFDVQTPRVCGSNVSTCTTETIVAPNGRTRLQVSSNGGNQSVFAGLIQDGELHCAGRTANPPGALAEFDNTSATARKTVTYKVLDEAAYFLKSEWFASDGQYVGCYGSPNPFNGFTNGSFGPAPFSAQDGMYVAQLPSCNVTDGIRPCFSFEYDWSYYTMTGWARVTIHTPAGDPRFT